MRIERGAADEPALDLEGRSADAGKCCNDLLYFGHHFDADAITREKKQLVRGHRTISLE